MKWIYQITKDGRIFSSRIKAHNALCKEACKDPETFLPTKEGVNNLGKIPPLPNEEVQRNYREYGVIIYYPNGWSIYKRPVL